MKKVMLFLLCLVLFVFVFPILAADNGMVGDDIVAALGKLIKDNTIVMTIYSVILTIIGIGIRVLLKKLPTVASGIVGKILWKLAAVLFGDGVVLSNNKDAEAVKAALQKKYPLFDIVDKATGE